MLIELLLVISLLLIVYNILIYPLLMYTLALIAKKPAQQLADLPETLPFVSIVIAAYNEEKVIAAKIENTLLLDYPKDSLEILIVSDGSDDDTPNIVESFKERGVIGLHKNSREGKSAAINRALQNIRGEIIVFSDANNDFSRNAIMALVKHFTDPEIGAVTGAKHIYASDDRESATGDGLYWKYESMIKKAESDLGSITAAEGEVLAVRRNLMKPINPHYINDDAAITFDLVKRGYRVLYEGNALSTEQASGDLVDDFNVKVRMTAGGYQTICNEFRFLFPPFSWFAFTFFSHKILRWITPVLMLLVFSLNLLLLDQAIFQLLLGIQILFYGLSYSGWCIRSRSRIPALLYIPMYFSFMNLALFFGLIAFLKRSQGVKWKKATR